MKSRYIFKKQATTIVSSGRRIRDYLMYLKGVGQVNFSVPNGFTEAKFFAPLYQTARYMKYEKDGSEREYEKDFPCGHLLHFANNNIWITTRKWSIFA